MNWKKTYTLSIVTICISLIIIIKNIYHYGIFSNILGRVQNLIHFIIFFYFIKILDTSIQNKSRDKNLHIVEYILYVFIALNIFSIATSLLFYVRYPGYLLGFSLIYLLNKILLVYLTINAFSIRKKILGKYNTPINTKENTFNTYSFERNTYTTIDQRLTVCKRCLNRKFDVNIGVVCSLNNSKPIFHSFCTDFNIDEKENEKMNKNNIVEKKGFFGSWKGALVMSLLGFLRAGLRGFDDPFSLVFLCLGIGWLVMALFSNDK